MNIKMNRRKAYSILAVLIVIVVYGYEYYLDEIQVRDIIEEGVVLKGETNAFFLPKSTSGQIVHHQGYSLSYVEAYEQAEWVAYELKKEHLSRTQFKRPYFEIDKAVKTKAAHWRNYKQSGYDRGHLCPAADRKYSQEAHDETFLTSNISPQSHGFNSGIWNALEQKVRVWSNTYDGVFVVTGGVLKGNLKTIGAEAVAVPNYFYKILMDYNRGKPKMIAFLMAHETSGRPLSDFVVSVDQIESLTGIDFFPQLNDAIEDRLEASSSSKEWNF